MLQELHILGVLSVETVDDGKGWRYRLADHIDIKCLDSTPHSVTTKVSNPILEIEEGVHSDTNFSGDAGLALVTQLNPALDRIAVVKEWSTPTDHRADFEAAGRALRDRVIGE